MKNILKEWLVIASTCFLLVGTGLYIQLGKGYVFSLIMFPLIGAAYIWIYFFNLKPLYRKIGIPPFLKGRLEFEISKNDFNKIKYEISKNSNYILCNSEEKTMRYLRDNQQPVYYNGDSYNILPVGIDFIFQHDETVIVHLKTNFGFSFIDHHGRYYLVQQELLKMIDNSP